VGKCRLSAKPPLALQTCHIGLGGPTVNAVTGDSHISLLIGVGQVWLGSGYPVVQGMSPRETPGMDFIYRLDLSHRGHREMASSNNKNYLNPRKARTSEKQQLIQIEELYMVCHTVVATSTI
jgi:hypothetical protein